MSAVRLPIACNGLNSEFIGHTLARCSVSNLRLNEPFGWPINGHPLALLPGGVAKPATTGFCTCAYSRWRSFCASSFSLAVFGGDKRRNSIDPLRPLWSTLGELSNLMCFRIRGGSVVMWAFLMFCMLWASSLTSCLLDDLLTGVAYLKAR